MKRLIHVFTCFSLVLFLGGCAPKSMVVLIPDPDGHVGQLTVANDGGKQILNEANQSAEVRDRKTPPSIKKLSPDKVSAMFSDALAAQPLVPAKFILYFLPDSNELTEESKAMLPQIIQTIRQRGFPDIVISGHTDTVGDKEYNYKLGIERAQMAAEIMIANGALPDNIRTTSHGEGNPLIKTDDEVAEPKNRRVEVVIK
jgi:outer membrane protein OmpA-like peptidoglycan-associated protein